MLIQHTKTFLAALTVAGAFTSPKGFTDTQTWEWGSSITVYSGDYGSGVTTDSVYIPATLQYNQPDYRVTLSVPFLYQDSTGDVIFVGGAPGLSDTVRVDDSAAGLGDLYLSGVYYALYPEEWRKWAPGVDLTASIKLPTADEDKGLGTGEVDMGFGFGLYDWFQPDWLWFLDWKYRFIGDPPGRSYDNQIIRDIGIGYQADPDQLHSVLLEERTAVAGGEDSVSALYSIRQELNTKLDVFGSVELGLSDGAPDYSLSVGFEKGL